MNRSGHIVVGSILAALIILNSYISVTINRIELRVSAIESKNPISDMALDELIAEKRKRVCGDLRPINCIFQKKFIL